MRPRYQNNAKIVSKITKNLVFGLKTAFLPVNGYKILNMTKIYVLACLIVTVFLVAGSQAATINIDKLGLWAGGSIGLGNSVSVDAAIAAGSEIYAGNSANFRSIYTENMVWLGNNATVSGTVLANKQAWAGSGLNLSGNWTGGSVYIGSNANITGDIGARSSSISLGSNASITGDILGNKNIWIGNNSTITGDARPGNGSTLSKGNNVTITGLTQPGSFSFDSFDLPELDQLQQSAIGTENISGEKYSVTTLLAGDYRDWCFDKNTTLNLSAGDYSLKNFSMNKDGVVNIDTSGGDVTLNVVGQFSTGRDVSFLKSGSGNLFINVFGHDVQLEDNVKLSATLKVYGGNFSADNAVQLAGRFYATGDIWLGCNTQLQYACSALPVPEPSTLAIFAAMGLFVSCKRK
jgi:carbonic anhydrase/acetyltransferase-like protein (isoleucine patch superfamily)